MKGVQEGNKTPGTSVGYPCNTGQPGRHQRETRRHLKAVVAATPPPFTSHSGPANPKFRHYTMVPSMILLTSMIGVRWHASTFVHFLPVVYTNICAGQQTLHTWQVATNTDNRTIYGMHFDGGICLPAMCDYHVTTVACIVQQQYCTGSPGVCNYDIKAPVAVMYYSSSNRTHGA